MDSYRAQYSRSPSGYGPGQNIYAPSPSAYSPPPSVYPKADMNYNPGFAVSVPSPVSPLAVRSPPEMPRAQTIGLQPQPQLPTPVTRIKTFAQWVAAAKENTLDITRNGSPSPLVWVRISISHDIDFG